MHVSVVIITKNEEHIIGKTLESLQGLTDDIIIVDNGSTDLTLDVAQTFKARIIETSWLGYGRTKNIGIEAAANDWILSLDADESVDNKLKDEIKNMPAPSVNQVFEIRYKNFFCNKEIRYGVWGGDKHVRLFNRKEVQWNDAPVHEELLIRPGIKVKTLPGNILHYTVHSMADYIHKTIEYARLNAAKYHSQGKRAGILKLYFAPLFNFIQHYFIRLGFLDGWEGYLIAKTNAWYTFLKYSFLRERTDKPKY